jgi:hypothetical protein
MSPNNIAIMTPNIITRDYVHARVNKVYANLKANSKLTPKAFVKALNAATFDACFIAEDAALKAEADDLKADAAVKALIPSSPAYKAASAAVKNAADAVKNNTDAVKNATDAVRNANVTRNRAKKLLIYAKLMNDAHDAFKNLALLLSEAYAADNDRVAKTSALSVFRAVSAAAISSLSVLSVLSDISSVDSTSISDDLEKHIVSASTAFTKLAYALNVAISDFDKISISDTLEKLMVYADNAVNKIAYASIVYAVDSRVVVDAVEAPADTYADAYFYPCCCCC